jgi:probable HAF family extracellular repeat protein
VFVLHPTNQSVSVDETLEVVVQTIGEQPITYTLLRDGLPVQVETFSSSGPVTLSKWINSANEAGNYWVAATNAFGGATSAVAQVSVHYAATIYNSPSGRKLIKGRGFALSVVANGDPPLAYQWFKNGTPIPGARESALSVASSSYSDTADYVATVSNVWRTATSSVARVTVVPCFYTARNLGVLKSGTVFSSWPSEAFDINNVGEVVGWAVTDEISHGSEVHHGFVWVDGDMIDLGDGRIAVNVAATNRLPGSSCAYSINDNFDIVGYYEYRVSPSLDGYGHAAHWRGIPCGAPPGPWGPHCPLELVDEHPRDISVYSPDTYAVAINARRQILLEGGRIYTLYDFGYLLTPDDRYSPITGFTTRHLGVSGGYVSPYAMNNSGLVVGRYREFIGDDRPFLYDGTNKVGTDALTNLYHGILRSVNDGGVVAGHYSTTSQGFNVKRPFLLHPDGRYEAPTNPAGGLWSFEVRDINNRNQIVGGNFGTQGALYEDGQWFTLDDLLVDDRVTVSVANAINDRGQIVGVAWFPYTGYRACLLTPTTDGANQSPVAADDEYRLPEPAPLRISTSVLLANDADPDGDRLSVVALGGASATATPTQRGGRASLQAGAIFYMPPAVPFVTDQFLYTVSDGLGRQDTARLTIVVDSAAPAPRSIINAPQILPDGTVFLSGSGPVGAVVSIYVTTDVQASYWKRDLTVTVPASGRWSVTRPGQVDGRPVFYRAETSGQP